MLSQCLACSEPTDRKADRYAKGQALAASGRHAEAILEFRNALKEDSKFGEAHVALGRSYQQADDTVNAYRSYQRAADLLPNNIDVQLEAARFLLNARQFTDARTRAERALQLNPNSADAHMVMGSALAGSKDVIGAITQVQEAIDLAPSSTTGYTGLGSLLLTQGKVAEAQAQFEKAVTIDPKSANARVALAAYHWSTGSLPKAEEILREAIRIDPDHATANRAMALLCIATGRAADAEPFLKTVSRTMKTPEADFALADYYVRSGRFPDARQVLEGAVKSGHSSASVRLARLDFAENKRDQANSRIKAVLARQPANAEAHIARGRWQLLDGKLEDAFESAEAATQGDPGNAAGYLLLGDVLNALKRPADATTAYNNVLRLNPRAGAAHTALSRLTLAAGQPAPSIDFARGALINEPGNDPARILLVRGLLQQHELKRAEEEIAVLVSRRPNDPAVAALRGTLKMRQGDRVGARADFEKALQGAPGTVDALIGLTALDAGESQFARARSRLDGVLAKDPNNVPLLMVAGRLDLQAGEFASGEARARKVIELDPAHLKAYELLGAAYIRQQKLDAARVEFERVLQKEPRSIGALTVLGMIHQAMGQSYEAEKTYERALQIDARAAVAGNNLAYMLAERGDNLEYALLLARDAVTVAKDDPVVLDTLGLVYIKRQQPAEAVTALLKAIRLAPNNPVYHFHLGLAYADAKDHRKARASLEQALLLNPNFSGAAAARDRLRTLTD